MKAVLEYPGSKHRLAKWICGHMPPHDVYVEPYAGSLAVFFEKKQSKVETLNDIDSDIVNYFRVIRDKSDELARMMDMTLFAREEYVAAYGDDPGDTDVGRALKFAVKCWQGIGNSNRYKNGWRMSRQAHDHKAGCMKWVDLPDRIAAATVRLKETQIENMPAVEVIRRYDHEKAFMYIDPPYLPDMRKNYLYRHEMTAADHMELLETIKDCKAKIIISGYDNDLYNAVLAGWHKAAKVAQVECGIKKIETIWMNYAHENQMFIFACG